MITDSGINRDGNSARGKRQDLGNKAALQKRQQQRRFIEDLDNLINLVFCNDN